MIYDITLTFTEPLLGTVPKNPEVYASFILTKAADLGDDKAAEEIGTVENIEESGWTGFHQVDSAPILYDYVIKGFFKDAAGMLRRVKSSKSAKVTAYKKIIDGLIFVFPRQIPLILPDDNSLGLIERPLRAQTAQGERVALARSDAAPAGTTITFKLNILDPAVDLDLLTEWLDYGQLRGLGQWRNSGMGRFTYTIA